MNKKWNKYIGLFIFVFICVFVMFIINKKEKLLNPVDIVRNYNDHIEFIFKLSNKFTVNDMGTINLPERQYNMYRITYNHSNNTKRYLIICGIHGHEIAPIYAIKDFIMYLDEKEETINNMTIDFIYILNPYGFEYNVRYNWYLQDLNHDFVEMKNAETKIFIENTRNIKYTAMYDFHEADSNGFFLYYCNKEDEIKGKSIVNMLKEKNIFIENEYTDGKLKAIDGLIYDPTAVRLR
jgi:predicted deacylase